MDEKTRELPQEPTPEREDWQMSVEECENNGCSVNLN